MKYKPGQRVRVKSLDWYNENKNDVGDVLAGCLIFTQKMSKYCACIITIKQSYEFYYVIEGIKYCFTDDMIEGLIDEDNESESIDNTAYLLPKYVKTTSDMNTEQTEIDITEEYEYVDDMGNVIDTKKIIIRKKPKYPTTYEECCKVINLTPCYNVASEYYRGEELGGLYHLLVCRDAYWKIAGEEMGTCKSWEPDWGNGNTEKWGIENTRCNVGKCFRTVTNCILAFPTSEMRDTFYENFKDLINDCKKLL